MTLLSQECEVCTYITSHCHPTPRLLDQNWGGVRAVHDHDIEASKSNVQQRLTSSATMRRPQHT